MLTFKELGFSPNLLKAIEELGFFKTYPYSGRDHTPDF